MKIIKFVIELLWMMLDTKGCILSTTTKKERDEMGISFDEDR